MSIYTWRRNNAQVCSGLNHPFFFHLIFFGVCSSLAFFIKIEPEKIFWFRIQSLLKTDVSSQLHYLLCPQGTGNNITHSFFIWFFLQHHPFFFHLIFLRVCSSLAFFKILKPEKKIWFRIQSLLKSDVASQFHYLICPQGVGNNMSNLFIYLVRADSTKLFRHLPQWMKVGFDFTDWEHPTK